MRLIDADALQDEYVRLSGKELSLIDDAPTVDIDAITESHERIGYDRGFRDGYAEALADNAEPVKHGEWRYDEALELEWCSECGFGKRKGDKRWYSYCPNCGAHMGEKTK